MVYSNKPIRYWKERRKRVDPIMQIIHLSNALVWLLLIAFLLVTNEAMPPTETMFDRMMGVDKRTHWDFQLLLIARWVLLGLFALSMAGILLNTRRLKRTTDHMRVSLIITAVFSFVGSIIMAFVVG